MAPRLRAGAYFASLDNLSIPDSARMEAGGRLARTALEKSRCLKPFCGIGLLAPGALCHPFLGFLGRPASEAGR